MEDNHQPKVEKIHNKRLSGKSRRQLLKTLTTAGIGFSSAIHLTSEDVKAANEDEVPIVYALKRNEKDDPSSLSPKKKMVPADWYNNLQHALNVHDKVDFVNIPGVMASWVGPAEYGGENSILEVDITDENARGKIPEKVEGVPVEVNKIEGHSVGNCNEGHHTSTDTPGGIKCSSPSGWGSLAPRMFGPSGYEYFATSKHLFSGSVNEVEGKNLYQPNDNYPRIGSVYKAWCYEDFVVADPKNQHSPISKIKGEGDVFGQYSRSGLSDLKAQGEPLHKVGVKTCHTSGQIQAVDGTTCAYGCTCKSGQLKWGSESDMGDGDSGSVNYHHDQYDSDELLVGGFNNARTWWPGENYVWGTAAHHIYGLYGYYF